MKLIKEHIGKKMRDSRWRAHAFFIPLAQASDGAWLGEDNNGYSNIYRDSCEDWEFFEEPKEEIELWSVWESYEMPQNFVFVFYIDNENRNDLSVCFIQNLKSGESCTVYFSKKGFLDKYKPRPDLEVVAPALVKEGQLLWQSNFLYSKEASIPDLYKWPASLALCQIVEKKK